MFSGSFFRSRTQPEPIPLFGVPRDILRTSFVHPSRFLREFSKPLRKSFENSRRTLEETSKQSRRNPEGCTAMVRRMSKEVPKDCHADARSPQDADRSIGSISHRLGCSRVVLFSPYLLAVIDLSFVEVPFAALRVTGYNIFFKT